ncbi:MAG TPA: sulfur carrier protein ThiS [Planctomycetes bacterium]|nr:sulfur carrier protein ThiS [Planctomycetota bacterium]HIN80174.1 sulfur carrier protein ThiS [Planctomycetota bacterium]
MEVTINGKPQKVATGSSVGDLVASLSLEGSSVAVERNKEIVPRSLHDEVKLEVGDRIEVVTIVGGG